MPGWRILGPALALVAAIGAASCGDDEEGDDKNGKSDPSAVCKLACDQINNCGLPQAPCAPATYVADCTASFASRKTEVECLARTACAEIAACFSSDDPCLGVSCNNPQACHPDTGQCSDPECTFRDPDQPCSDTKFCHRGFCVETYGRTYRFTFRDVLAPPGKGEAADEDWDADGAAPDLYAAVRVNGAIAARSGTLEDTFESADFDEEVPGGASLTARVGAGDTVLIGMWDDDGGNDEQVVACDLENTSAGEGLPGVLRESTGINCRNEHGEGVTINIDPI